jgi:hypothetical protein
MCTVSYDKEMLHMTIHNQYPGLELVSPVYFSSGTIYHAPSSQQKDTGNIIESSFGIDSKKTDVKGAVLYKLQRKRTTRIGNRSNSNASSIKNTATNMYLLVVWNVKSCHYNPFYIYLIECTDDFAWNEDKLWALYWKYNYQFYMDYKSNIVTWLMNDNTVMKTKLEVTYGSDYKLDIVLSKGTGKYNMKEPMKINPKRSVCRCQY